MNLSEVFKTLLNSSEIYDHYAVHNAAMHPHSMVAFYGMHPNSLPSVNG